MISKRFLQRLLLLGALAVIVSGTACSRYPAKVSGTVTIDGNPLPLGSVMFFPMSTGTPAHGSVGEDGAYMLFTGQEKGLPPGDYIVTVVAHEPSDVEFSPGGGPPPTGQRLTPMKYQTKKTSGLKFSVKKGQNTIDLELSSKD